MMSASRGVGDRARDKILLKEVALFHLSMVAECCCCGHKRLIETDVVLDLIERYGETTTMKRLAPKLRCAKCNRKEAEILFRTGERSDDWWPRKPYNRRN